jgi:hypothetical protein
MSVPVDFEIKFHNVPSLKCQLDDTELSKQYLELLKSLYTQDPTPVFRDPQQYTIEYFKVLAEQANKVLGWNWNYEYYDTSITTLLHKDIETYLANGYKNIPEKHDHLLNELHFCLHAIQSNSKRTHWLQVEWFNDNGFYIDEDNYPGKLDLNFGDLRLQNPYVGHHPLYVYEQQDYTNITQTCKFHDFVKPGINIVIKNGYRQSAKFDWTSYIKWFEIHDADFVKLHGVARLKKFTGHPIIGSVQNKQDLVTLLEQPVIKFESIMFS